VTRTIRLQALFVAGLALAAACSGGEEPGRVATVDRQQVMTDAVATVVVPAYEQAATAAAELAAQVGEACAAPGRDMTDARQAWQAAQRAWAGTSAFSYGPRTRLRLSSKVDYPVDPGKIDALLASEQELTADTVAALGADQRSLSGIEYVLFADTVGDRECAYMSAAATIVVDATQRAADEWATYVVDDPQMVLEDVVNGMILALVDIADRQLGPASGSTVPEPQYDMVDDGRAQFALEEMRAAVEGVVAIGGAIEPLVAAQSEDAAQRLGPTMQAVADGLAAIDEPIAAGPVADITAAYTETSAAVTTLRTEIASLLGITLTLGDSDGDS
jgi:predicted lipoprotein